MVIRRSQCLWSRAERTRSPRHIRGEWIACRYRQLPLQHLVCSIGLRDLAATAGIAALRNRFAARRCGSQVASRTKRRLELFRLREREGHARVSPRSARVEELLTQHHPAVRFLKENSI